jgi:hypothetical protein
MTRKTRAEWKAEQARLDQAVREAEQVAEALGLRAPVDPLAVVRAEHPLLKAAGGDLKDRYDGQLEYHPKKGRFLLFYNTKYDRGGRPGEHHPRTRFSIAHELGHYYLAAHRAFLMRTGTPHPSSSEFRSDVLVEREADAFASGLLLPSHLFEPVVNEGGKELSAARVQRMADDFRTSFVSTVIRAVRLSDLPCGVVGLRGGKKAWSFLSDPLIEEGAYPGGTGSALPTTAKRQWTMFERGEAERIEQDGKLWEWFQTYENDALGGRLVTEGYVPVPSLKTLVVLVTTDPGGAENPDDDDDSDEEEEYVPSWNRRR